MKTLSVQVREDYECNRRNRNISPELREYLKLIFDVCQKHRADERASLILETKSLFTRDWSGEYKLTASYDDIRALRSRMAAFAFGYSPFAPLCAATGWALESLYQWVHAGILVAGPNPFRPDYRLPEWVAELEAKNA